MNARGIDLKLALTLLVVLAASSGKARAARAGTVFTNTEHVQALTLIGDTVWAATRGGVETFDAATLTPGRRYTTVDGLPDNDVRDVSLVKGHPVIRTDRASCVVAESGLVCASAPPMVQAPRDDVRRFRSTRITAALQVGAMRLVGTAGDGIWLDGPESRRVTTRNQICSNHVIGVAAFGGSTYFATFDQGLCRFDGKAFWSIDVPFQMANDIVATPRALYVATTTGLYVSTDGLRFRRMRGFDGRGVVDLAADAQHLWAVTATSLWRVNLEGAPRVRQFYRPGRTTSLQAVDVGGGRVWLASEDRGGMLLSRNGHFRVFDRAAGLPTSWALDVVAGPDGGAWLATLRHGLVQLDPRGRVRHQTLKAPDDWFLFARYDSQAGALLLGTQGGAATVQDGRLCVLPQVPHASVHGLFPAPGGMWVTTEGGTMWVQGAVSGCTA